MPRYFFNLSDGTNGADTIRVDLAGIGEARRHARTIAREITSSGSRFQGDRDNRSYSRPWLILMDPNLPACGKCDKPMRLVANMPPLSGGGPRVIVFFCEPCGVLKWIEE